MISDKTGADVVIEFDADSKIYSDSTQWVAIKDLTNNLWNFSDYDYRGTFVKM